MADFQGTAQSDEQGAEIIPFPTNRTTPPPLPKLKHHYPTPGGGSRFTGSMFGAALTRRFDQDAA
jgi:hypothetical protein